MVDSLLNDIEFGENWNLTPRMNFLMQGFFWPVEWTEHYPSNFTKIKKTISMPRYEIIKQLGPWQGEPNTACCLTIGLAQKYKSFPTERFGRAISWRFRNLLFAPSGILTTWFEPGYIYLEPKLSTEEISLVGRNFISTDTHLEILRR